MRPAFLLSLLLLASVALIQCGAAPSCTGNGQSRGCSGNGSNGGPSPPVGSSTAPLVHVQNAGYVGLLNAGQSGTVTHNQICANVSIAFGANEGNGPGRQMSENDCGIITQGYFRWGRPGDTGNAPGVGMASDPAFVECGTTTAWFLHSPTCTANNRIHPVGNNWVTNFGALATATWWQKCFDGTQPVGTQSATTCGSATTVSPLGPGDVTANGFDKATRLFGDSMAYTMFGLTSGNYTTTVEVGVDPAVLNLLGPWLHAADKHANGQTFPMIINGMSHGGFPPVENGRGSCEYTFENGAAYNCLLMLAADGSVIGGMFEWCGQNPGGPPSFYDSTIPYCVNTATDMENAGQIIYELIEPETGVFPAQNVQVSSQEMMDYYVTYLLTYNPANPTIQVSWLDADQHTSNASNLLSSWPIQQIVPTGAVGIAMVPYLGNSDGVTKVGYAGCTPAENDSGGIIPYLVAGSCGTSVNGSKNVGVYCNGNTQFEVAGGANVGAVEYCVNLTNATYNTSLCARITADTGGATLVHQVDIGQISLPNSAPNGDILTGTMTTQTAAFACATPNIPSDGAIIATP